MIKSGGEWISSVDLENTLMAHPGVREAAVIAVHDPKWRERPLAIIVARESTRPSPEDLAALLATRFDKWQIPDGFIFVDELPRTSVGKIQKSRLREQFQNWRNDHPDSRRGI
jgi:fatty-acyl-CoA synthase